MALLVDPACSDDSAAARPNDRHVNLPDLAMRRRGHMAGLMHQDTRPDRCDQIGGMGAIEAESGGEGSGLVPPEPALGIEAVVGELPGIDDGYRGTHQDRHRLGPSVVIMWGIAVALARPTPGNTR